ncbi:MAG TPA: hypothetical protein VNR18_01865, partial [Hyphomicrobiales bacterium]|nr:hypothetical protein [Hyphomicrobiales bacterium]
AAPQRSTDRFLALARERLEQTTLSAPVLALGIAADQLLPFEQHNHSLIPDARSRAIGWEHLMDKLGSRLGADRLYRLHTLEGHRPEQTSKRSATLSGRTPPAALYKTPATTPRMMSPTPSPPPRPLWLLDTPRALHVADTGPRCQGHLRFLAGPERIESGWWDGQPARRDYYVVRNAQGETFWIYREHQREEAWYLHGIFV